MNVDDAVDDMFRQIRGVSDDISGALKTATTGIRQRFPTSSGDLSDGAAHSSIDDHPAFTSASLATRFPLPATYLTDSELSEKLAGASVSEDEYGGNVHGLGYFGWQSDSDGHVCSSDTELLKTGRHSFVSGLDVRQSRFLGSRLDDTFSDGHSPVGSNASETVADDLGMPREVKIVIGGTNTSLPWMCLDLSIFSSELLCDSTRTMFSLFRVIIVLSV